MGINIIKLLFLYILSNTTLMALAKDYDTSENSTTIAPRAGKVECLEPTQAALSVFETQKQDFVDENREVKEVLTDIVVKEFFQTPESLYNFLETTYTTINDVLDAYRKKHGLNLSLIHI